MSLGRLRSHLSNTRVTAVLASPWHRRRSGDTLALRVTGPRTAERCQLPVSYVRDANQVLVFVNEASDKRWSRNLRGGAPGRGPPGPPAALGWAEAACEDDPPALARVPARFVATRPGFVDLDLPPADSYSPDDLLSVAHGCAVISIRVEGQRPRPTPV